MKRVIMLFVLFVVYINANAQWETVLEEKGDLIFSVFSAENSILYACRKGMKISEDLGQSFSYVEDTLIGDKWVGGFFYIPKKNLLFTNVNSTLGICASTDLGKTWAPRIKGIDTSGGPHIGFSTAVHFDSTIVAAISIMYSESWKTEYYKTYDYGENWQLMKVNLPQSGIIRNLVYNLDVLYAFFKDSRIYSSTDKGQNWSRVENWFPDTLQINQLVSNNNVLFAASAKGIYQSNDNGKNWVNIGPVDRNVNSIVFNNSFIYGILGENTAYRKEISVDEWETFSVPERERIKEISFLEGRIICHTNNRVFLTEDDCKSWKILSKYQNVGEFANICISDNKLYVPVRCTPMSGYYYDIFTTEDNGENWSQMNLNLLPVNTMKIINNKIFLGMRDSGLYYSGDIGLNWENLGKNDKNDWPNLSKSTVNTIYVEDSTYLIGTNGFLYKSTNMGETWQLKLLPYSQINKIENHNNKLFLGNSAATILVSSDFGENWDSLYKFTEPKYGGMCYDLYSKGGILYACLWSSGEQSGVWKSTDDGISWEKISQYFRNPLKQTSNSEAYKILIYNNLIIVGTNLGVFVSSDNGENWVCKYEGMSSFVVTDLAIKDDYLFCFASNKLYRIKLDDLTGVRDQERSQNLIVFPNPASDYILIDSPSIKRGLGGVSEAIRIFDVFGNCALTVETGLRPVSTKIDISSLPAGVYLVRIGENVEKFVVVR